MRELASFLGIFCTVCVCASPFIRLANGFFVSSLVFMCLNWIRAVGGVGFVFARRAHGVDFNNGELANIRGRGQ